MSFGTKVQELRNQKNITQEELAEQMDVTRQTVSRWETDIAYPDLKKIVQLSNYFHISTDYLLKNEDETCKDRENGTPRVSRLLTELVGKRVVLLFSDESELCFDGAEYDESVLAVDAQAMTVRFYNRKKKTQEDRVLRLCDVVSIRLREE